MSQTLTLGQYTVELSNQDKVFFPDTGLTKGDLTAYYQRIADTMLPHLKDRPVTMHRFPDGIDGDDFYQQQISDYFPEWIERVTVEKEGGNVTHVVCNNAATLVYLANQACITPHIWLSRTDKLYYPDRMILDLDPSGDAIERVRQAALGVNAFLIELGLTTFVMTSGSEGYHLVVPLDRSEEFDAVRDFVQAVAQKLVERAPDQFTTEQRKDKRGNRVFLDTVRNSYAHTGVAPYAIRAKPGAPVATPLEWDEVDQGDMHPQKYTLTNIFRRLGQKADPWRDIKRHTQSLSPARKRLVDM
jgi:bifunctional non-homologous end joining protein LigD